MAGDWIKMRSNLDGDPRVVYIAELLHITELHAVGLLWKLWSWADQHTIDGNAPSVTSSFLDRITCVSGFANAVEKAGWLDLSHGVILPRFEEHNGQTAKNRALTQTRVKRFRNAPSVTPALPEKRREEKSTSKGTAMSIEDVPKGAPSMLQASKPPTPAPSGAVCSPPKSGIRVKPSEGEAELYASKIGLPMSEVPRFWDYYESNGWKVGKNPMRSWQGAMRNWKRNWEDRRNQARRSGTSEHRVDVMSPEERTAAELREIRSLDEYAARIAQ